MLRRLSPQRRRLYLTVLVLVVGALLVTLGLPLARGLLGDDGAPAVAQDQAGPVLLVPGYGGSVRSLQPLADRLSAAGRDVTIVDLPGDGTGDLRTAAASLASDVDAALARTGAGSVDLVGYSAGGEVVRWYVAELDGAALTRRVVTLGSPHHGTDLAALAEGLVGNACPTACRQLAPDSDLLRRLNRDDETPAGPLWTAIWSQDDQTVVPPDSGRLDGAVSYAVQDVCPDLVVAHGDLPATGPTIRMVDRLAGDRATVGAGHEDVCAGRKAPAR